MAAGWFMYAYARSQGLGQVAALVAALGYMFSAKWFLHLLTAGHYITLGMTWIPLTLLFLDMAVRKRCLLAAILAGCSFALLILCTHPQWILYGGVLIAAWSLGPALEEAGCFEGTGPAAPGRIRDAISRWLGFGVVAAVVAVALAAIQLLPTYEMSKHTSRQVGIATSVALGGGSTAMRNLAGPALQYRPDTVNAMWEDRGGMGVWWLAAAVGASWLTSRRLIRYQACVGLALVVFAIGGAWFFEWLPGFRWFRQPARMLLVVSFPAAYLTGVTTDAIFRGLNGEVRNRCGFILSRVFVVWLVLRAVDVGLHWWLNRQGGAPEPWHFHPYWVSLAVTTGVVWRLFITPSSSPIVREQHGETDWPSRRSAWLWVGVLVVDLLAMSWPQVHVKRLEDIFPPSQTLAYLDAHREPRGRVLDRDREYLGPDAWASPLGPGAPLAPIWRLEAVRGYNPLDVLRYKEYLQFLSGTDKPLRGLGGGLMYPVLANFPLRLPKFLDVLNVRYVLWPSPNDEPFSNPALLGALAVSFAGSPMLPGPLLAGSTLAANEATSEATYLKQAGWRTAFVDPAPLAFNFLWGGVTPTRPYIVYENTHALPRAYVVSAAAKLPPRDTLDPERSEVLPVMKATDFRRQVLFEDWEPPQVVANRTADDLRTIAIKEYHPNRVVLDLAGGPGGYLVLADIWYPGWNCTVDGSPAKIHRANFLFRGVELPDGAREAVFTFEPPSYFWGKRVTWCTLAVVAVCMLVLAVRQRMRAVNALPQVVGENN
jgi:hypothetical protein